jgi:tRNA modification GTPase
MTDLSSQDPIAALATPWGESAIAVIRTSGGDTLEILSPLFAPSRRGNTPPRDLASCPGYSLQKGSLKDVDRKIDEVLVAVYRKPGSYTGENAAEIFCHGGPVVIREILDLLFRRGFRQANPGEFTLRAFLNGKVDLTRAEAVNELIRSKTDQARALALSRLSGGVERRVSAIRDRIVDLAASLEVHLDVLEEDLPEEPIPKERLRDLETDLESLLATYRTGKVLQNGITVVIAGKTNAGKSTLFNLLLREERALVSEHPGTTRDYLEGAIALDGIPVRLFDTAGLRNTIDPLEREGIRRTDGVIAAAGLVLFLVDATEGFDDEVRSLVEGYAAEVPILYLWNKIDLTGAKSPEGFLPVSAETGEGLERLHREIVRRFLANPPGSGGEVVIDSDRQKRLLEKCLGYLREFRKGLEAHASLDLLAVDLREAMDALGELTGDISSEEVLTRMFSRFCVGK